MVVADIHLRIVSTQAQPVSKAVTGGDVIAFGQHFAVVDVARRLFAAAQVGDVTLDIVFGVAVNQTAFHIYVMFVECFVVAYVQVQVVTVFRFDAHVAHFEVFVTEHFLDGRQAVGFFVRQLGLQARQYKVGTGSPVSHGVDAAGGADIF